MRYSLLLLFSASIIWLAAGQDRHPVLPSFVRRNRCCPNRLPFIRPPFIRPPVSRCRTDRDCNIRARELCCLGQCLPYSRQVTNCCCPKRTLTISDVERRVSRPQTCPVRGCLFDFQCRNGQRCCYKGRCGGTCVTAIPCPAPPTLHVCCPDIAVIKRIVAREPDTQRCNKNTPCQNEGDICCKGYCIKQEYQKQNCCCPAEDSYLQCNEDLICQTTSDCGPNQKCCRESPCGYPVCRDVGPCPPEPEPTPHACCPNRTDVSPNTPRCGDDRPCRNEGDICCHGYCIGEDFQNQNCCCPAEASNLPCDENMKCETTSDCGPNQKCCRESPCGYPVCRDVGPCPPDPVPTPHACCPNRTDVSIIVRKYPNTPRCDDDHPCRNEGDICCHGYCIGEEFQNQNCCCPAEASNLPCDDSLICETTNDCGPNQKCCRETQCDFPVCRDVAPCPEPAIPQGCCPAREQVGNLIGTNVLEAKRCNQDLPCPGDQLCCFGYCIPTIHQSQNCCCPVDEPDTPCDSTLPPCESDADCNGNEQCCEHCQRKVCRAPVTCPCDGNRTCLCEGDPHCRSYDGHWWHFHGTCEYSFTRDGCINGQPATESPNFHVTIKQFSPYGIGQWAYVQTVTIHFPNLDFVVIFYENGDVYKGPDVSSASPISGTVVDGPVNIDVPNQILSAPALGLVHVQLGRYTWALDVRVSCWMRERLCGLCADYNGDPGNDRMIGPHQDHCPDVFAPTDVPGSITTDTNIFGMSWQVSPPTDNCTCDLPLVTHPTRGRRQTGECAQLYEVFKNCSEVNPVDVREVVHSCQYDTENAGDFARDIPWRCEYAALLSELCDDENPDISRLNCGE